MLHNHIFCCGNCGHEMEVPASFGQQYDAGQCRQCKEGQYQYSGETYDQEFLDEEKYNQQQDREYEERHRYDDRH